MKTRSNVNKVFTPSLCCLLAAVSLVASPHPGYAQNKVVVVPLLSDAGPQLEPTAPIAKVNPSQTDYTIMANTVIDKITGLEWQRENDSNNKDWNEALDYCGGLNLESKTDWRLPDIIELQSIIDYGQTTSRLIETIAFPNTEQFYWSASSLVSTSASGWIVNTSSGNIVPTSKAFKLFVRCVR